MKAGILLTLFGLLWNTEALQIGTNCVAVTCEIMEGNCADLSQLELKIVLSDNCGNVSSLN